MIVYICLIQTNLALLIKMLRSNKWVATAVSILIILIGLIGFIRSYAVDSFWGFLGMLFFAAIVYRGGWMARQAKKHFSISAEELLANDHRRPVIYLRSFDHEEDASQIRRALVHVFSRSLPGLNGWQQREQEEFAEFISQVGPYIAVGRPGEILPESGAARLYLNEENWKSDVSSLLRKSQMVVLRASTSNGLSWEISHLFDHYPAERVLVILPNTKQKYLKFAAWANTVFPHPFPEKLSTSRLLYFDSNWVPLSLPAKNDNLQQTLAPFFVQNRIQIPDILM